MSSPTQGGDSPGFRPDVEGLRGVAVLIVVLFHANLASLTGGFIGVDVFFVISGFLITGLLVREQGRSGTISLSAFYARRVRRLLPAAMVALVITLVAAMNLIGPLDRPAVANDGAAAALSVANIRFAMSAGDYFASVSAPSPFLHFWSLGVEEQFYLVWPALILLVTRGAGAMAVRRIGIALALVVAVAFAANLFLTDAAANWAFYSLPTRAWQLGLGGLLAIGAPRITRALGPAVPVAAWAGLASIVAASILYDSTLPYPGVASVLPTVATIALLAAGMDPRGPGRLLAVEPVRLLGRLSYSLYLWHWPVLVLGPLAIGANPDAITSVALVGISLVAAYVSYRFVETPFRHGPPLVRSIPARTVTVGIAGVLAVVMVCSAFSWRTESFGSSETVAAAEIGGFGEVDGTTGEAEEAWVDATPVPVDEAGNAIMVNDDPGTAAGGHRTDAPSGTLPPAEAPTAAPTKAPPGPVALARNVTPSLARARGDEERLRADGCLEFERVTEPGQCVYGLKTSEVTVALVGDSHAAQWFPTLERVAKHEGWKMVVFTKVSCPFVDFPMKNIALKREYRECEAWNANVVARLRSLKPDLTLISMSRTATHPVRSSDNSATARGEALARYIAQISGRVGVIVDTPYAGVDVPGCLSTHTGDIRACAIDRGTAFAGAMGKAEKTAARISGATLVDLTGSVCPSTGSCPVVVANHIVYRDIDHLTRTFAASLAPQMASILIPLVNGR